MKLHGPSLVQDLTEQICALGLPFGDKRPIGLDQLLLQLLIWQPKNGFHILGYASTVTEREISRQIRCARLSIRIQNEIQHFLRETGSQAV